MLGRLQFRLRAVAAAMATQRISNGRTAFRAELNREAWGGTEHPGGKGHRGAYEEPCLAGAVGPQVEGGRGELEGHLVEVALEVPLARRGGEELAERSVGLVVQAVVQAQERGRGRGQGREDRQEGDMACLQMPHGPGNGLNMTGACRASRSRLA